MPSLGPVSDCSTHGMPSTAALLQCVDALAVHVQGLQHRRNTHYCPPVGPPFPPLAWEKKAGLFPSDVKFTLPSNLQSVRRAVGIPNNNGFVTLFVTQFLLEAAALRPGLPLRQRTVGDAVRAILEHRDRNRAAQNAEAPLFCFWTQKKQGDHYVCWPTNIAWPLTQLGWWTALAEPLVWIAPVSDALKDKLKTALAGPKEGIRTFGIPPDFDDTFVAQALGAHLNARRGDFPEAADAWAASGGRPATEALVRYAYRPHSQDKQENTIDSRTYLWLRDFVAEQLDQAEPGTTPKLALATTWAQNLQESGLSWHNGESMPGGVNNVDGSVATNVLFGITTAALLDTDPSRATLPAWLDEDVEAVYSDTARMVSWIIDRDLMADDVKSRAVLLYYPSTFDFFYFAARLSHLLENPPGNRPLPAVMQRAKEHLTPAMRGKGTEHLLRRAQREDGFAFWEDKLSGHDDRLFSTAAALNALLDTWTVSVPVEGGPTSDPSTQGMRRQWIDDVPLPVVQTVEAATRFLAAFSNPARSKLRADNVFFSASTHAGVHLALPANVRELADGTQLEMDSPIPSNIRLGSPFTHGMSGHVPSEEYARMEAIADGYYSPSIKAIGMDPEGARNKPTPVWSSPAVTYGLMMLALVKAATLTSADPRSPGVHRSPDATLASTNGPS